MEVVEEGPSGMGAGPGEVCPACGTSLETTEEAETHGHIVTFYFLLLLTIESSSLFGQ